MTLNGGIKCTDVLAILPSSGWHKEITSSLFVVVCHFENVTCACVCNLYERKVAIHSFGERAFETGRLVSSPLVGGRLCLLALILVW